MIGTTIALAIMMVVGSGPLAGQATTLREAVVAALAYHPSIRGARATQAGAEASLAQSMSGRLPTLGMTGSAVQFQQPMIVAPLHSFDPTRPPQFSQTLFQSEWAASYSLFDGGTRGANISASRAELDASTIASRTTSLELTRRVAEIYLAVLSANQVDAAARQNTAALESEVARTRLLFEEGRVARVGLLRAQAAMATARAQNVSSSSNVLALENELRRLTGLDQQSWTLVKLNLRAEPYDTEAIRGTNPAHNTAHSTAIEAAQSMVIAGEARVRAAKGSRLPSVSLETSLVTFGSIDGSFSGEVRGGIGISFPIFTGGARSSAIDRSEATAWQLRENLRAIELEVDSRLDAALIAIDDIDARQEAMELSVSHQREVARIELLALEAGAGVQTDYLRSESQLFAARASLIELRHQALLARITVAAITGELSVGWLDTYLENSE